MQGRGQDAGKSIFNGRLFQDAENRVGADIIRPLLRKIVIIMRADDIRPYTDRSILKVLRLK